MKIFCYGDSNTYGWDPRDTWGMPYDNRWPKYLRDKYGYIIVNSGQPGREIPVRDKQLTWLINDLIKENPVDVITIMLGTNDILNMFHPSAEAVGDRMEKLVEYICDTFGKVYDVDFKRILLISPVSVNIGDIERDTETARLGEIYERIAAKKGISFLNADEWGLSLAYDRIHLTEEAHIIFAQNIHQWIADNI